MKPTLQLKIGQSLAMTPQLQQAIKLLQLSSIELEKEIQEALETNPMLESIDENNSILSNGSNSSDSHEKPTQNSDPVEFIIDNYRDFKESKNNNADEKFNTEDNFSDEIPESLPVDTAWESIYPDTKISSDNVNKSNIETNRTRDETLKDHLLWQMELTPFTDIDKKIATTIIDSISEDGYLQEEIEEIQNTLNKNDFIEELDVDEIEAVLRRIQMFDPIGVGARSVQECLTIQLKTLDKNTPFIEEAKKLVLNYLDLLGEKNYSKLKSKLKLPIDDLDKVINLIQSLNPRPGNGTFGSKSEYIIPDVIVSKEEDKWVVKLNEEFAPKIRINPDYSNLIKKQDASKDNKYLKDQLTQARWFLKSISNRNDTLLKVSKTIVEKQRAFLEYGDEAMKPMVLSDIALEVDMHESTISRVTTNKYILTPKGVFELKYFFSSHVTTQNGGEASSKAIRAVIKKLIEEESRVKPLSDDQISKLLKDKGIIVARRTVAKYREAMQIPPSSKRKKLV